jgi:hypothetical protein
MSTWVKWWKYKFVWMILLVIILAMTIAFLFAYFFDWGWIVSIISASTGGFIIRKIVIRKIDDYVNSLK